MRFPTLSIERLIEERNNAVKIKDYELVNQIALILLDRGCNNAENYNLKCERKKYDNRK